MEFSFTPVEATASGGGGPRRKVRKTAVIDGKEIQVSSYEEAVRLFQHFNKTEEVPVKKRIQYKVYTPKPRFVVEKSKPGFTISKRKVMIKRMK